MRVAIVALTMGVLTAAAAPHSVAQSAVGQITGRVIDADSKAPIAGVRVQLVLMRAPNQAGFVPPPVSTTDEQGIFTFTSVAAGRTRLNAQKQGYAFDPRDASVVDVLAGQTSTVELTLRRGGVLTGRVLDERGEPLSDMRVAALRRMTDRGNRVMPAGGPMGPGGSTNDLGEFRLAGLVPGEYTITATPMPGPMGGATGSGTTTFAPTFYPGVTAQDAAQFVTLQQGDTINGLEFRMQSVPAFKVAGVVVDESGQRVAEAMLTLRMTGPGAALPSIFLMGRTNPDGTFVIDGVMAGSYVVSANRVMRMAGGASTWSSISGGPMGPANEARVDVRDADVTGVRVIAPTPRQQ